MPSKKNNINIQQLIIGAVLSIIGITLIITIGFFTGPLIGIIFLISGLITIFSEILYKINKNLKFLIVIIISILSSTVIAYLSMLLSMIIINKK